MGRIKKTKCKNHEIFGDSLRAIIKKPEIEKISVYISVDRDSAFEMDIFKRDETLCITLYELNERDKQKKNRLKNKKRNKLRGWK